MVEEVFTVKIEASLQVVLSLRLKDKQELHEHFFPSSSEV